MGWASHISHQPRQSLTDMAAGQSVRWGGRSVKTCSLSVREAEGIPGGSLLANLAKSGSSERLTLQVQGEGLILTEDL